MKADLAHFEEHGYVVHRGVLDVELDLNPVVAEYGSLLDRLAQQWQAEGQLSDLHAELPFNERIIKVVMDAAPEYDLHFDISLPQADIREDTPMHHGPAVFKLLTSPRLLDVVEQFVGPEIYSNPVQHTRIKLPEHRLPAASRTGLTAEIAWHQDLGVITPDADDTNMLTVWFPMTRANEENGCLAVVPGSHRKELSLHCHSRNDLTLNQVCIPEQLMDEGGVTLPMEPGDVLFMHRRTRHCGMPNRSEELRWSFDLRYHPIGQPTGREWFPGFVARSQSNPGSVLTDAAEWSRRWQEARHTLANSENPVFNRWKRDNPLCA